MAAEFETVRRGIGKVDQAPSLPIIIDPPSEVPFLYESTRQRYKITSQMAGIVERLAHARYVIRDLLPSAGERWEQLEEQGKRITSDASPVVAIESEEDVIGTIAQSVYASSEIEGEAVYAQDAMLALIGKADVRQSEQGDYADRIKGAKAIYAAYIWALTHAFPLEGGVIVSVDFIKKLHQRMFSQTKPHAGEFKTNDNMIQRGGRMFLRMLPHQRVVTFMQRLCDRTNSQFRIADQTGRYSKLLATCEFLVDFLAIHPFADGNGRTARLLSTYLLERAGFHFARFYPLDTIILERQQDYYKALMYSQANWYTEREDMTPWATFYLDAVSTQWQRAHEHIVREAQRGPHSGKS